MPRVTLHKDRRSGRAGAWVLVIDGVACASGERESMIELVDITYRDGDYSQTELVTHVACVPEKQSA